MKPGAPNPAQQQQQQMAALRAAMISSQAGEQIAKEGEGGGGGSDGSGDYGGGATPPGVPNIFVITAQPISFLPEHESAFSSSLLSREFDGNIALAQNIGSAFAQFALATLTSQVKLETMFPPVLPPPKEVIYGKAGGGPVMMG